MIGLIPQRVCAQCNSSFWPSSGRQRFCGSKSIPGSCSAIHYEKLQKVYRRPRLKQYQREYYKKNKERISARAKANYQKNRITRLADGKKRQRPYLLKKLYGLTQDQYKSMLAAQGGVCAICKGRRKKTRVYLCVDHSHETNKVRGLLCFKCNLDLGVYERSRDDCEKYLAMYGEGHK